jgi:hypothetical protein
MCIGDAMYSTSVDTWSVGCILAELLSNEVLFSGDTEFRQLTKIFELIGVVSEENFPGYLDVVPDVKMVCRTSSCCSAKKRCISHLSGWFGTCASGLSGGI